MIHHNRYVPGLNRSNFRTVEPGSWQSQVRVLTERAVEAESTIRYIDGDAGILTYRRIQHSYARREGKLSSKSSFLLWNERLPEQVELDSLSTALVVDRPGPPRSRPFLKSVPKVTPIDLLRTGGADSMTLRSDGC